MLVKIHVIIIYCKIYFCWSNTCINYFCTKTGTQNIIIKHPNQSSEVKWWTNRWGRWGNQSTQFLINQLNPGNWILQPVNCLNFDTSLLELKTTSSHAFVCKCFSWDFRLFTNIYYPQIFYVSDCNMKHWVRNMCTVLNWHMCLVLNSLADPEGAPGVPQRPRTYDFLCWKH